MSELSWKNLVSEDEVLSNKTFYRIAGYAQYFAEVSCREQIVYLLKEAKLRNIAWRVMGSGTNLVIQNGQLRGLTLRLARKAFKDICLNNNVYRAGCSALYPSLVKQAVEAGFEKAADLGGIPGTLGGALVMNAGGHHGEIGDFVLDVSGFDAAGQWRVWKKEECGFAYRHSELKGSLLLSCRLDFGVATVKAKKKFSDWVKWKAESQPTGTRSAGCIFKNPEGHSAGQLIDASGFKGKRIGDIEVSFKHANFLLNHGEGNYDDLKSLIEEIKKKVHKDHGIWLEEEVEIWENDTEGE